MPYWRSHSVDITEDQRLLYLDKIQQQVNHRGYCLVQNDYPYDRRQDQEVKPEHYTLRYQDIEKADAITESMSMVGYTVIEHKATDKSCPEIRHRHFLRH